MRTFYGVALLAYLAASVAAAQQAVDVAVDQGTAAQKTEYSVGGEVAAPELIGADIPLLPTDTCSDKAAGKVVVSLLVDEAGSPLDVTLHHPEENYLEKLAVHTVERDHFKPGTLHGTPVLVKETVEVTLQGCFVQKDGPEGKTRVFRLTAQPGQKLGVVIPPVGTAPAARGGSFIDAAGNIVPLVRGSKVKAPLVLNSVQAQYTEKARLDKVQGVSLISLIVDAQGRPQAPAVIRSLRPDMDVKAMQAVMKYRFKPATMEGKPVATLITVEVNFRLY
jgi:TonB family protein